MKLYAFLCAATLALCSCGNEEQAEKEPRLVEIGLGYGDTSVNTAVFRNSSLVTHAGIQYAAYYGPDSVMMLAKRVLPSTEWEVQRTQYKGNVADAHNVISLGVDGDGYLHVSFDHHGHPLKYCRSIDPGSLQLGELQSMDSIDEENVTYPEFYNISGGDLLGAYRSGSSGRGNLVMKRYDTAEKKWHTLHTALIDGEGERNAYWQLCTDAQGTIHLSWVWRETWMVETNHDLCYAKSCDGGLTWQKSDGTVQELPITATNAEYAMHIPQNSELINQTSMGADVDGNPFIATYWRDADSEVPQYRLVWHDKDGWQQSQVGERTEPFSLAGGGTKMIPIARPRLATDGKSAYYIMRDAERGSKVTIARTEDLRSDRWEIKDYTDFSVDAWEPSIDNALWQQSQKLHVFVQASRQGDGEKTERGEPTAVYVLEVN